MNNRIFEIIQDINGQVGLQWEEKDKQELAELIVRECLSLCQKVHDDFTETSEKFDIDMMQRQIAINICKRDIKQYFGVENERV